MSSSTFNNLSYNHYPVDDKINFHLFQAENENIDIETRFFINFSPKSTQEETDSINYLNFSDTNTFISSTPDYYILNYFWSSWIWKHLFLSPDPSLMPSFNDFMQINSDHSDTKNDSISSQEKPNLFTNTESDSILVKEGEGMLKRKRFQERRPRKENQDNIRKKIKRGFFNCALIKKLNEKLKGIGSRKYLRKFPQHFVSDVNQTRNKDILGMTLEEIFCKKELYLPENKEGLNNFLNNLKVIKSEEVEENEEFRKILNKTIKELYEEYINSDEFKVDEINRLKEKKMKDEYIERYISLARYLIAFFTQ